MLVVAPALGDRTGGGVVAGGRVDSSVASMTAPRHYYNTNYGHTVPHHTIMHNH